MPIGAAKLNTISRYFETGRTAVNWTAFGDAQIDTAQSKFGGSSLRLDGSGDYIEADTAIVPSTADFTIEFWFRTENISAARFDLFSQYTGAGEGRYVINTQTNGELQMFLGSGSGNLLLSSGSGALGSNTWYHIAITRSGTSFTMWLNGNIQSTGTSSAGVKTVETIVGAQPFTNTLGWIDEVRVSDTVRYSTTFTPSTTAFVNDANTLTLLHLDGADGSTVFEDDVG